MTELIPNDKHLKASIAELLPYEMQLSNESLLGSVIIFAHAEDNVI